MRALPGAVLAASLVLGGAIPAAASCAPPVTVAENAARAAVVVYGTVAASGGSDLTVRVDRVLKGDARTPLRVFAGPGRGGAFAPVATSVDYKATVGSDHVLYLVRGTDGQLETSACGGSHPGPPSGEELSVFGTGTAPVEQADATVIWALAAVAIAALLAWFASRRRAIARGRPAGPR